MIITNGDKQQTIQKSATLAGIGLHTGAAVTITFQPSADNTGIRFQRIDTPEKIIIAADVDNVVDTARGTTIASKGIRVSTVEHLLAAATALGIDNLLIEIDGPEVPIMDGSAKPFMEVLEQAGIHLQNAERKYYEVRSTVVYKDETRDTELMIVPADGYTIKVMIDFNSKVLGFQHAYLHDLKDFKKDISGCKTFVFLHELQLLIKHNLIKGGDLSNAIVIVDKPISEEELDELASLLNKPKISITKEGILNNIEQEFPNEAARHKLLDVIGDLSLAGMRIKGQVIATKPGHAANVELARKIKQLIKQETLRRYTPPALGAGAPPVMNIVEIQKILPHRSPFLLIDKIIQHTPKQIIGVKNVTFNEYFFQGHFPDNPIMPGVLIIEAMAQIGGVFALKTVENPEDYLTYFLKIDQVRFKKKVVPGDSLVFKLDLMEPIRRGICHMFGQAFVNDELVAEGELLAQIIKVK